jgi:hypothetical protein
MKLITFHHVKQKNNKKVLNYNFSSEIFFMYIKFTKIQTKKHIEM